jgi:hypothetical protein
MIESKILKEKIAMDIKTIKSHEIKKALNAGRVYFRWHNKNKNGCGNFGINVINSYGNDFEFTGHYDENGLTDLSFGILYGSSIRHFSTDNLKSFNSFRHVLSFLVLILSKIEKVTVSS